MPDLADYESYKTACRSDIFEALRSANTLIACSPEDTDQIFGFISFDKERLYYVYVKKHFRCLGIGTALINRAFSEAPKETPIALVKTDWILKQFPKLRSNPHWRENGN